ncbi:transcriptional regulator LytR [Halalkalibacillus sediminis]|uniref:Transcriptional regulator LytR n=1 Tax=Halalkalibacillus sediminis TaxID=2018042 RepID=A0A2I0QTX9_9BACI|nr:LCP family protein [Halalkalibacillus sediminis]PKR77776.1 transcriptional regulator LytR [Halalkalibacillus sediminis]
MESRKERREQHTEKKSRKKKIIAIIIILLLIIGGLLAYLYYKVGQTVDEMHTPVEAINQEEVKDAIDNKETINILLLGVDEREGDVGRSDTMVLASLNPHTNEMLRFNIPRDTFVEIPGRGMDKINHAYAFGGSDLSVQTVENFLDTEVHFYSRINMEGLQDVVDAIGGVTVTNDQAFSHGGHDFREGEIDLNGEQALIFSRMRKQDPEGDLGRNDRQQQIIDAFMDEAASFDSVARVNPLLDAAGTNAESNVEMDDMRNLFLHYRGARDETIKEEIQGSGQRMNGLWYYVVSDEEQQRIRSLLSEHMEAR